LRNGRTNLTFPLIDARQRVLVVCPHTDDEFGCAGTIHKFIEAGAHVTYIALSRCEASVPDGYPIDALETECRAATKSLGVQDVRVERFPVRYFPTHRQEILELLVQLRRDLEPSLVMLPSTSDTHQDHSTVAREGFRAFKSTCSILGYELPQNLISFTNTLFVGLSRANICAKIDALRCYESQLFRRYAADDFVRGLATVRGAQCDMDFAEAFEAVRVIA
jgi:N-acetylglucosamine malate deacetylase 1